MVEKIKESRNLENYVIIDFFSLKKYTTESSRHPPLVPLTFSLQYHRYSLIRLQTPLPSCTPLVPKAVVLKL